MDTFFQLRGEVLEGIDAVVVGLQGIIKTVQVTYPIPEKISVSVETKNGQTFLVEVSFAELWFVLSADRRKLLTIFDVSGRHPRAHRLVDH